MVSLSSRSAPCFAPCCSWRHSCARSPHDASAAASVRRGDAGRDADPVVRRPADRQPGDARERRRRTAATRSRWPDGVLRQRAAPPLHVRVDRPDREPDRRRARSASDERDELLVAAPAASASSRCRPSEQRSTTQAVRRLGRACAHPVPLGEGERRRLDRRDRPPAARGTRSPAAAPGRPRPEGQGDDGHRGVLDARPGQRGRAGATSASSRAVARGRRGEHHRVRVQHLLGSRVGPTTRDQPPVGPAAQVAGRWRRCARWRRRRPRAPRAAGPRRRGCRRTPGRVGTRRCHCGGGSARQRAVAIEQGDQLGYGGAGGDLAGVPGVHPAQQRLDQPVDHLVTEPLLDQVADARVAVAEGRRRQHRVQLRPRTPLFRQHVLEAVRSTGTPIRVRGIGRPLTTLPKNVHPVVQHDRGEAPDLLNVSTRTSAPRSDTDGSTRGFVSWRLIGRSRPPGDDDPVVRLIGREFAGTVARLEVSEPSSTSPDWYDRRPFPGPIAERRNA